MAAAISRQTRLSPAVAIVSLCVLLWVLCCSLRLHFLLALPDGVEKSACPYMDTVYRLSTYVAGVVGAMAVQLSKVEPKPSLDCRKATRTFWLSVFSYAVIIAVILFGGEPAQFVSYSSKGAWYAQQYSVLLMFHAALLRPAFGVAVAYLLFTCATNQAPRLTTFLSAKCWRPIAGLSYSLYLLQNVALEDWFVPVTSRLWGTEPESTWSPLVTLYAGCLFYVIRTVPLALGNYAFVERTGILVGRTSMTTCARCLSPQQRPEVDATITSHVDDAASNGDERTSKDNDVEKTVENTSAEHTFV
jgi:peptidoglycan/LPS O-acetylase OafA/YrhL